MAGGGDFNASPRGSAVKLDKRSKAKGGGEKIGRGRFVFSRTSTRSVESRIANPSRMSEYINTRNNITSL